jgi:hypothetical protein
MKGKQKRKKNKLGVCAGFHAWPIQKKHDSILKDRVDRQCIVYFLFKK